MAQKVTTEEGYLDLDEEDVAAVVQVPFNSSLYKAQKASKSSNKKSSSKNTINNIINFLNKPSIKTYEDEDLEEHDGMQLEIMSWDEEFEKDMESGIGFIVDDPKGIDSKNNRSPRGIYTSKFGTELSDKPEDIKRYSCACKEGGLKGVFNEGIICPKCNQPVQLNNNDIKKTGWIVLREDLHLITPIYYFMLEKVIGRKSLNDIIYYSKERDADGNVVINMDFYDKNNPYYAIGMTEFYNKFDEILDYYKDNIKGTPRLKQEKLEIYEMLKETGKEKIFVNHFPVFSLILRPILMIQSNLIYDKVNTKFEVLLTNICDLNDVSSTIDTKDLKVLPLLYQCQKNLNSIHDLVIKLKISGKDKHIRGSILGERVNYSSRSVIVPLVGKYDLNEIILPYQTFLELYKNEIMNLFCKIDNMSINDALRHWNKALEGFDRKTFLIMKQLIEETEGGLYCYINRNPTLNYGSVLTMHVVDVKEDESDLTLSIPLNVLQLLNADFDGDVMNLISLKSKEFVKGYDPIFNPKKMTIDRDTGLFQNKMNLFKDQMIGLYAFCKEPKDKKH